MCRFNTVTAAALGLCLVLASACSSADRTAGPNARPLSLSFTTRAKASPSVVGASSINQLTVAAGGNTLVINKAQVVFSKIELAAVSTTACTGDDAVQLVSTDMSGGGDNSECEELRADPALVALPVDASVTTALVSTVPAGTYTDFQARIRPVNPNTTAGAAFLATHPTFAGVSVHVEGTYNGTAFTYDGESNAKLELAFSPPIVVMDASGLNITVNVDLSTWFRDGAGGLVDPATANTGGTNEALVEHNIHESFEAFEDDNHDGHDDHH